MITFEQIEPALSSVEGWMTDAQGALLSEQAARVPAGDAIVEIGSHRGRSTIVLALSKSPAVSLLAVDPFDDPRWGGGPESLAIFDANLERAGVSDRVERFRGLGEEAARAYAGAPVGLLYLDGAHDFPTVSREITLWKPHLAPGARVLFHDMFSSIGVTQAVLTHALRADDLAYVRRAGTLAAFERRRVGRVKNGLRLTTGLPYFARNVAVKVALRRGWTRICRALGHHGTQYPY